MRTAVRRRLPAVRPTTLVYPDYAAHLAAAGTGLQASLLRLLLGRLGPELPAVAACRA